MTINIIIPTYNEAAHIGRLITYLRQYTDAVIWVINSPNTQDDTANIAMAAGAQVLTSPKPGRASQMNYGAKMTNGEVLYFVHADTLPPPSFITDITQALQNGVDFGYFSYAFVADSRMLQFNSYCTRFDGLFAGGGDQTLFMKREVFEQLDGFREELCIMEDFDLVKRAKNTGYKHRLIANNALVSARKYVKNTWLRVNLVNLLIFTGFYLGASQEKLHRLYRRLLRMD